jgi:hypothetical protein
MWWFVAMLDFILILVIAMIAYYYVNDYEDASADTGGCTSCNGPPTCNQCNQPCDSCPCSSSNSNSNSNCSSGKQHHRRRRHHHRR